MSLITVMSLILITY